MTQPRPRETAAGGRGASLGTSALRASALQRLAFVAGPLLLLWVVVALALDLLA